MRENIRSKEFEKNLDALKELYGNVVEEVYDALEWEIMRAEDFDSYQIIFVDQHHDRVFRAITSKLDQRSPQLTLVFCLSVDADEDEKTIHIGLRDNKFTIDDVRNKFNLS
jgi:hypothetical protein